MKHLIATLRELQAAAPSEPPEIAKLRTAKPPPEYSAVTMRKQVPPPHTLSACIFHTRRRDSVADALTKAGFQKITIRHERLTLTVWNTKETFAILIKNATRNPATV